MYKKIICLQCKLTDMNHSCKCNFCVLKISLTGQAGNSTMIGTDEQGHSTVATGAMTKLMVQLIKQCIGSSLVQDRHTTK